MSQNEFGRMREEMENLFGLPPTLSSETIERFDRIMEDHERRARRRQIHAMAKFIRNSIRGE